MVAIIDYPNLRKALNYNENKLKDGRAAILDAHLYHKDAKELSFNEKYRRMKRLIELNDTIRVNCLHISLNFDPSEQLPNEKLQMIAKDYMEGIGFGGQPYLLYEHYDAAHPHLHIVTVTIKADGTAIYLNNIGKNKSAPTSRDIEAKYGLIPAIGRQKIAEYVLRPADLEKALYGKAPTKSEVSRVVKSVTKYYKFTSLHEFNAVLNQFNVVADRGQPGTRTYEKGGLLYSLLDDGKKVGIPIKASAIHTKPTLERLERHFHNNKDLRKEYATRLRMIIDETLQSSVDKNAFIERLKAEKIDVILRENPDKILYGITFVDHKTLCVFNGSDLGKRYSAKGISERWLAVMDHEDTKKNRDISKEIIGNTDFAGGIKTVLSNWAQKGLLVDARQHDDGRNSYWLGHFQTSPTFYYPADQRMTSYFYANSLRKEHTDYIAEAIKNFEKFHNPTHTAQNFIRSIIDEAFKITPEEDYISYELLKEAKRKRRNRNR